MERLRKGWAQSVWIKLKMFLQPLRLRGSEVSERPAGLYLMQLFGLNLSSFLLWDKRKELDETSDNG